MLHNYVQITYISTYYNFYNYYHTLLPLYNLLLTFVNLKKMKKYNKTNILIFVFILDSKWSKNRISFRFISLTIYSGSEVLKTINPGINDNQLKIEK